MKKTNCWEYKQCGRGPAGKNPCAAAQETTFNGMHGGVNAGRACWVVAGTGGEGPVTGVLAASLKNCLRCDFFKQVETDERSSETGFSATRLGMLKILEIKKTALDTSTAPRAGKVDTQLRKEFVQEVSNIMSRKNGVGSDLIEEFTREVERLSSEKKKK